MQFTHRWSRTPFEIPDEWWAEAGMECFAPTDTHFNASFCVEWPTMIVSLEHVTLPVRAPGVPLFVRNRIVRVLWGIRLKEEMPAVEVHVPPKSLGHRYFASVAVGFTELPVFVYPYFNILTGTSDE